MLDEKELTYRIRGCVYEVFRGLGCGFLEKVYERALLRELRLCGFDVQTQFPIEVKYKGFVVGEYFADILIENTVIVELKAQREISKEGEAQLLNYLKATGIRIGMLVNFSYPKATVKRFVL